MRLSGDVEFRGYEVKQNSKGENYSLVRVEDAQGSSAELYSKGVLPILKDLKKGSTVKIVCDYLKGKYGEKLAVTNISL